ncbi:MAG: LEA type 2 family protein [Burkholderiales bacterium]|nr:LEA type 2 family protein [Burkholderiales bacterium]
MRIKNLTALTTIGWLVACSGLPLNTEPPRLSIAGLSLTDANLFEQRFKLELRVQNPNDFALPIHALNYVIEINDQPFATGVSNRSVTVPGYGSDVVEVEAISNLGGLLRQVKSALKGELRYRLRGDAIVGENKWKVPFEQHGEVDLAAAILR